jgi:hypothetical protein
MWLLAEEYKIKPWECNDDGEVYKEDISNLIAIKQLQHEAEKREIERSKALSELRK